MAVEPVPRGLRTVTASLTVKGAKQAIEFYKNAFGAELLMKMESPDGGIGHAELKIGDSVIFLNDEFPQGNSKSPVTLGGTTGGIQLYVNDVDSSFKRAIDAVANHRSLRPRLGNLHSQRRSNPSRNGKTRRRILAENGRRPKSLTTI
jgi:PhnB protein